MIIMLKMAIISAFIRKPLAYNLLVGNEFMDKWLHKVIVVAKLCASLYTQ